MQRNNAFGGVVNQTCWAFFRVSLWFVQLLMDWTYYKERECENAYHDPGFYGSCYADEGSLENILGEVEEALMNPLIVVHVKEGAVLRCLLFA